VYCESDCYGEEGYTSEEIDAVLARVAMAQKYGFHAEYHPYTHDEAEH
jgi:hypothetical protein